MSDSMDSDLPENSEQPENSDQPENSEQPEERPNVAISQAEDRDAALAAVLREQTEKAEVEAQAREVRVRLQGFGSRHLALTFAAVLSIWIWRWPPGALQIAPSGPPALEEEEATLRLVMYFQAQKIEQYLLDTGGVPLALVEAGPVFRGMEYIRLTNSDYRILGRIRAYDLDGREVGIALTYSSVEPLDVFLGAGASVLDVMTLN